MFVVIAIRPSLYEGFIVSRGPAKQESTNARGKIINAALTLIRTRGYAATSVDSLCELAQVTKGGFFHHFKSKEDLAVAAAEHWFKATSDLFAGADYQNVKDPKDRLIAYIRLRRDLLKGTLPEITCLAGTMVQEVYVQHPVIQQACENVIFGHARTFEATIEDARRRYAPESAWTAESLSLYIQASIQGAFILAKAKVSIEPAVLCLEHLERYVELVFSNQQRE